MFVTSAALIANGSIRVKAARHGLMAFSVHDTFIGRSLDLYGEWSPGDARLLAGFLRPGMTVLDIGANIGTHAVFLANSVGPLGSVLAFEPVPALFQLLCCNLALNGIANTKSIEAAVGRANGRARVPDFRLDADGNFGAAALSDQNSGEEVRVVALDDMKLGACDLIKADAEGMEGDIIAGATRTIRRFRPILYLENEEPTLSPVLIGALAELDYKLYWHAPTLFAPDNFFGNPVNVFPGLGSLNLLGLPNEGGVAIEGLLPVAGPEDWPAWWPDWSSQQPSGFAQTAGASVTKHAQPPPLPQS